MHTFFVKIHLSYFFFFICQPSSVSQPKEGHVKSWGDTAGIQSDSTTCAWDEIFDIFVMYIYVYRYWFQPLFLLLYVQSLIQMRTNYVSYVVREPPQSSSSLCWFKRKFWSLHPIVKTKIKCDSSQIGSTWDICFWCAHQTQ